MTKAKHKEGEYVPREFTPQPEPIIETRLSERVSLRESEVDLSIACDGICVKLYEQRWLLKSEIGLANIKDISGSGVGFITPITLDVQQNLWVEIEKQFFEFTVMRHYPVNGKLNFIGGQWKPRHLTAIDKLLVNLKNRSA